MSNGASTPPSREDGGKSRRNRGRRRKGPATPQPSEAARPDAPRLDGPPGVVLERLRERIRDVVREIDSLRAENHRLSQQVATLQEQADAGDPALLRLDDTPEALREKVESFIEALDTYLEGEAR